MKKVVNRNFILATVLALALLLVPLGVGIIVNGIEKDAKDIEEKMEILREDESFAESGYEMPEDYTQGMADYARMLFYVILFLVGGYALVLFLTALMAWIIYRKDSQKLRTYRVIMGVHYVLHAGVIYVLLDMVFDQFSVITLVLAVLVTLMLLYSAGHTYSKRISADS